ncbi:MAG: hypothetical protein RLZZ444_435, partial [Pseudomonadota bacterium]
MTFGKMRIVRKNDRAEPRKRLRIGLKWQSLLLATSAVTVVVPAAAQEEFDLPPVTVEAAPEPVKPEPVKRIRKSARKKSRNPVVSAPASVPSREEAIAVPGSSPADATRYGRTNESAADTPPAASAVLDRSQIEASGLATNDAGRLVSELPGGSVWLAGGVSGLPAINGLAADRVQVALDGMLTNPACPNQMNPTMSYVAPEMIGKLHGYNASAPVSVGGDFTGGKIVVEPVQPEFAGNRRLATDKATDAEVSRLRVSGFLSTFYRSNARAIGTDAKATVATGDTVISYSGSWVKAGNYRAGDDTEMLSTEYQSQNHALQIARRFADMTMTLQVGGQYMPYQGFPSQPMDLTMNKSAFVNGRLDGTNDLGDYEATAYGHWVRHRMDLLDDKLNWPSFDGTQAIMPMDTRALDLGTSFKQSVEMDNKDTLRFGVEAYSYHINDWWDPVDPDPSAMMSPYRFINLNGATRNRLGAFVEWERAWDPQWTSIVGLRMDDVWMNTGRVHGYSSLNPALDYQYGADAEAFNRADRARNDLAFDGSALLRWEPADGQTYELSAARRTRAPNLYERYSWSTNVMAMQMTGWFGDGNGYVGNLDLEPEVNHSISLSAKLRDTAGDGWEFDVSPFYSFVDDYIDADRCMTSELPGGNLNTRCGDPFFVESKKRHVYLRFANHDAHLFGVNASGRIKLAESEAWGRIDLRAQASAVRGVRTDGDNLYNIMPFNGKVALEQRLEGWNSGVELQMVGAKDRVSQVRNEVTTSAYTLVNLRAGYEWNNRRLDFGIDNLFDTKYEMPLGGQNLANYAGVSGQMASFMYGYPMLGPGRSLN